VFGDAVEDVVEIGLRVEPVELRRSEQGEDGGGAFYAGVRSLEEIVLSSERDDAQSAFGGVVVDFQLSIVDEARERKRAQRIARRRVGLATRTPPR